MDEQSDKQKFAEWPTWVVLVACYVCWLVLLFQHQQIGSLWVVPTVLLVTLHSSLQHEMLHGHPTKNRTFNELLVFPAIGLLVPYRRFRDLHLKHHRNEKLTDPYDDPESWYLTESDWQKKSRLLQTLLKLNSTLTGRILIGPVLSMIAFLRDDIQAIARGDRAVSVAWLMHIIGLVPVLVILANAKISVWFYLVAIAYPAMSVLMIRTFIEHRASEQVSHRTAVVEAGKLMSLLFLNNNLHAVHHRYPSLSWHRLPAKWQQNKSNILKENSDYHFPKGYLSIAGRWLFSTREPVIHPLSGHSQPISKRDGLH